MEERKVLDSSQLTEAAATVVGQIVLELSHLEFNVGLYLRNVVGGNDVEAVDPLLHRLAFKGKLDALLEVMQHKCAKGSECLLELREWHKAIDKNWKLRNSFVHGRWGIHHFGQKLVNVHSRHHGAKPEVEARYGVEELDAQLVKVKQIVAAFHSWAARWPA